jgi:3-hydroxyisobutyrate dehydrogenase-like beta-hydroxyacid dehydrogenase
MPTQNRNEGKTNAATLACIGFGEAAKAFVAGWQGEQIGLDFAAYDIKTDDKDAQIVSAKQRDYQGAGIAGADTLALLLQDAGSVFSLVTADQAQEAARAAAQYIRPGTLYFDGNSCAPKTKIANARLIDAAGAHYVDTAIMAPVHPKLHKTPILLSGPYADQAQSRLAELGMDAEVEPGEVGRASSIKMIRSVMVKGMESLVAECMLAGRRAGVEDIVLASLEKSWPGFGWRERASYNLDRMMVHGVRRAAEMREVALTIADLGIDNSMSHAITDWQQSIGDLGLEAGQDDLAQRADKILAALDAAKTTGTGE